MLIDSPIILSAVFQRCRMFARGNARSLGDALALASDLGDALTLASDILSVVDQQGKFLIDVPEGWVPHHWVSAVKADTQRGIEYMQAMQLSDYDVLTPEKRRQISLLQLLVRELQRLLAIGENFTVYRLGHAFHNVHRELRTPVSDTQYAMGMFRVISADWDMLSMEMREDCCRVVALDLQEAEALINTPGFSINTNGARRFKINTLISRSTALHKKLIRVLGTVREVTVYPPIPVGEDCTMHNGYSLVLEDETGSIVVEVIGKCRPGEPVPSYYQGKRVVIDGTVEVLSHGMTKRPLVILKADAGRIRLMSDSTIT